jgi:putative ABC transport system permease protein
MFKNYLKGALRNMRNQKIYSFINISGLAISLAASILLLLWVKDEMSFNRFNVKSDRLYKLASQFKEDNIWGVTPAPVAIYAKNELPEVENACRISGNSNVNWLQYRDTKISQKKTRGPMPRYLICLLSRCWRAIRRILLMMQIRL